ncbi:hypothetical protein FACS189487_10130 [Campylobacterota bacterium]|nr:hypothetical protein FACS189487_10130 [Campylobacterota bacterium]
MKIIERLVLWLSVFNALYLGTYMYIWGTKDNSENTVIGTFMFVAVCLLVPVVFGRKYYQLFTANMSDNDRFSYEVYLFCGFMLACFTTYMTLYLWFFMDRF